MLLHSHASLEGRLMREEQKLAIYSRLSSILLSKTAYEIQVSCQGGGRINEKRLRNHSRGLLRDSGLRGW